MRSLVTVFLAVIGAGYYNGRTGKLIQGIRHDDRYALAATDGSFIQHQFKTSNSSLICWLWLRTAVCVKTVWERPVSHRSNLSLVGYSRSGHHGHYRACRPSDSTSGGTCNIIVCPTRTWTCLLCRDRFVHQDKL